MNPDQIFTRNPVFSVMELRAFYALNPLRKYIGICKPTTKVVKYLNMQILFIKFESVQE